jgi:ATP-dependent helicase/nuclease subunit A
VKLDEAGQLKAPDKRSLLAQAWPLAQEIFAGLDRVPVAPQTAAAEPAYMLRRIASGLKLPSAPDAVRWNAPNGRSEEQQIEFSWAGETARQVGTIVHRWLQRMADDALEGWSTQRVVSLWPRFCSELRRHGVPDSELKVAADLVSTALSNTLLDERGRWLMGPHAEAWTEYAVHTQDGRRHVIDRRIRDADGTWWVVDYKTSRHEGANIEAFLERERERYAPQLARYAHALGATRMGLYFPLLRGWREWTSTT